MSDYEDFIRSKAVRHVPCGREPGTVHPSLFPFQRDIVEWAVRKGRAAIFADTGLGKTRMQVEWARIISTRKALILAPLAVAHQTVAEAERIGVTAEYVRSSDQVDASTAAVVVANYEMLDALDPAAFDAVVLDESSILKSYTGTTKQALCERFASTPYRLCCTATPAPNDHMELGNHADFLGIMASNEMLARWFVNDAMQAGVYKIKAHGAADFWKWITSWAVACRKPSDVGPYADDGYVLPALEISHHVVTVEGRAAALGKLFIDADLSATEIWQDKRTTAEARCTRAAAIVASQADETWIVWCDTNDESKRLTALIPGAVEVAGSMTVAQKESRLRAFSSGESRIIVTKPDIAGFGLNWQHCARVVFVGLTYSYEKIYQAMRRSWRFGQTRPVQVHFINVETEQSVADAITRKQSEHQRMMDEVVQATKLHGLGLRESELELVEVERKKAEGKNWTMLLGDCVASVAAMPDNSIDFCVHSPPFSNLYIYSDGAQDMGNSSDHAEFFKHYAFLTRELFRVTRPGRLVAVHCKDLPLYMNRDGAAGLYDFPGDISRMFSECGFTFHSRVTIWKDPVIEMQRTKNHGLLHKNFVTRGEVCRQGMADYVLVFRANNKGVEIPDHQIQRTPVPGDYIGDSAPEKWDTQRDWSIQLWQKYASPVWFDIRQTNVLDYRSARSDKDEKHICPLQLDVIERCVWLWSNPGDTVLSPFAGIGSEGFVSVKMGRKFIGCELKPSYFEMACLNLAKADRVADNLVEPSLFDDDGEPSS